MLLLYYKNFIFYKNILSTIFKAPNERIVFKEISMSKKNSRELLEPRSWILRKKIRATRKKKFQSHERESLKNIERFSETRTLVFFKEMF